jgi:uncharacterized pyridoxal phosphate-dependent enzyme
VQHISIRSTLILPSNCAFSEVAIGSGETMPSYQSDTLAKLGVRSWINAHSWITPIGGSILDDKVIQAMADVAHVFCDMNELLTKASKRVAELCQVDAAFITSGAAAGIVLATAACITGCDTRKMNQLFGEIPGREDLQNEVVMQTTHSTHYDYQYWQAGGHLVRVGWAQNVEAHHIEDAINEKTACIVYVHSYNTVPKEVPFTEVVKIARRREIPVIVDSAPVLPPASNLHKFTDQGADLVIFSGGKAIQGPNDTGIILGTGKKGVELIEAIQMQASPRFGVGRPFKVSKEQIVGLVTALELFLSRDEKIEYEKQMAKANFIVSKLSKISGLKTYVIPNDNSVYEHPSSAHVPKVYLEWDEARFGLSDKQLDNLLSEEDPPISLRQPRFLSAHITSHCIRLIETYFLKEGEETIVTDRLEKIFKRTRP